MLLYSFIPNAIIYCPSHSMSGPPCNCIITILCSSRLAMCYHILYLTYSFSKKPTFIMPSSLEVFLVFYCWHDKVKIYHEYWIQDSAIWPDASFHLYDLPLCHMNSKSNPNALSETSPFPCFAHLECLLCLSRLFAFHLSFMTQLRLHLLHALLR